MSLGFVVCILKRSEHGAHVAGTVVIHYGENDGVHKSNHVLGAVGRDAQQHIRGKNVEEENEVEQAGNVEHGLRDGVIIYHNKKKIVLNSIVFFFQRFICIGVVIGVVIGVAFVAVTYFQRHFSRANDLHPFRKKQFQVLHDFFADDGVHFLLQRGFRHVFCAKVVHEPRNAGAQFGGIDAGSNGGSECGCLHEPVQQRVHAELVHVRLDVDVVHARVLHFGVQLVVQKTHLHIGRQFGAPHQVLVRLVVGGATHFNDFAVHFERGHDSVKHGLAQLGFQVFSDVLHPNARAAVVRVDQHAGAVPSRFQKLQQF